MVIFQLLTLVQDGTSLGLWRSAAGMVHGDGFPLLESGLEINHHGNE